MWEFENLHLSESPRFISRDGRTDAKPANDGSTTTNDTPNHDSQRGPEWSRSYHDATRSNDVQYTLRSAVLEGSVMIEMILKVDNESRIRLTPREAGGFRYVDEVREPCRWRTRGTKLVTDVSLRLENLPGDN